MEHRRDGRSEIDKLQLLSAEGAALARQAVASACALPLHAVHEELVLPPGVAGASIIISCWLLRLLQPCVPMITFPPMIGKANCKGLQSLTDCSG